MMNPSTAALHQLRDEALTYLVLWAASRDYSPDIEAVLKHWAATFEIPESELHNRLMAAADGKLMRPGAEASPAAGPGSDPTAAAAGPAAGPQAEAAATTSNSPTLASQQQQPQPQEGAQPTQNQ